MKQAILVLFTFFSFGLIAQDAEWQRAVLANMEPFHINVDVKTAKQIARVQGGNLVYLDIRTPEEIAVGKINGAVEMDIKSPDFNERLAALDKTKQYMVYCYAGGLSSKVMHQMRELGFKQVYNLEPGYRAWKEESIPTDIK